MCPVDPWFAPRLGDNGDTPKEEQSRQAESEESIQRFSSNAFSIQDCAGRLINDWSYCGASPPPPPSSSTQIPGRRKHGLARAGRGLKHWLHAGDDGDGGCGFGRLALGCDHDDHVAFLQILKGDGRSARQQLLKIRPRPAPGLERPPAGPRQRVLRRPCSLWCTPGPAPWSGASWRGPETRPAALRRPPLRRAAIRCATAGSSFFTSLSGVTEMTTGFLVAVSVTVIVDAAAFTAWIGPARLRKLPLTISSASSVAPSALFGPRARSWSPGLIWSRVLLIAWSNLTEPGA